MIIDFHVHSTVYNPRSPSWEAHLRRQWGDRLEWMLKTYASPEAFVDLMDECGLDYAVVLAELAPITTGICSNEHVAKFCSKSHRLIPFASINPQISTRPALELEKWVRDHGFKGLKLYPTYQLYYPNDPIIYPLYAKAQELGIPVSVHLGSSVFEGSRLKYGDPLYMDDVAVDFPDLSLLMCHCGRPFWYDKAFGLARLHENLHMEVSGLPPKKLLTFFPNLEAMAHKVVYGSDWPGVPTIKENIRMIEGLEMGSEAKRKILGENAARLLNIKR
jgi:predicted TIM-barrel fold metal-dependent hydrolase